MKRIARLNETGFTLFELIIGVALISVIAVSVLGLSATLVSSARYSKLKAVALSLSTNKMEYLKSLPYDSLAVSGGSIVATSYLPATEDQTIDGFVYTVRTDIDYVDEAYDGCASYPSVALAQQYCRNYPAPTGSPTDTNPKDYKILTVSTVLKSSNKQLAEVSTYVSARVAETSSTTGALFLRVVDSTGTAVSGVSVSIVNSSVSPAVNQSDNTDINGIAIFYDLPPDTTNYDYVISVSKAGYSSLTTIVPTGTLNPYYPNQQIIAQQSSQLTMTIDPKPVDSLVIYATNTSGAAVSGAKIYVKGGYKKYNSTTNTDYYYDTITPSDTRGTTDAGGYIGLSGLDPGPYIFCGDAGATSCSVGATTYYLAAAVPFAGANSYNPITVPTNVGTLPSYTYNSKNYPQEVQLVLTTSSTFPRIQTLTPDDISLSTSNLSAFAFTIKGVNLPCNANPASCGTVVRVKSGASTYVASCTGTASGVQLNCTVNITGIALGAAQLEVVANSQTYTSPVGTLGGFNVVP